MKELSIEEKAKAYDDVLERAKGLIDFCSDNELKTLKYVFPELAESYDEKIISAIRKAIEAKVENLGNGVTRTVCLAWLEKQGQTFTKKDIDDAYLKGICDAKIELEKQGEQNHCMIQWKGDNLKEVIDFTGKDKNFEKWFKSFEEYEKYVQEHDGIFKLFNADGSHYEVPVGAWIVKTPDGYNVASKAIFRQKPADKAESKFKVGDYVVDNCGYVWRIEGIINQFYILEGIDGGASRPTIEWVNKTFHLWDITDAKDGDILHSTGFHNDCIFIFNGLDNWKFDEPNGDRAVATGYCCLSVSADNMEFGMQGPDCVEVNTVKPATKIQRDLLFRKIKEAGYEWDAEKKELKEIENEEYDGEDYGIDSLWHAKNILKKTLGKVDGYQSDDGILEHKCAISAVDKLYKQKPSWSAEETFMVQRICKYLDAVKKYYVDSSEVRECIDWLKSLEERVLPRQKQEWSEDDRARLQRVINFLIRNRKGDTDTIYQQEQDIDWLKAIKDRYAWKPSAGQIEAFEHFVSCISKSGFASPYDNMRLLYSLLEQLKKLKY